MQKHTIRLPDRKHSLIADFKDFFMDLENLVGRDNVGLGSLYIKGGKSKQPLYDVVYYDQSNSRLRIKASSNVGIQTIYVHIDESDKKFVEGYIKEYGIARN